MSKYNKIPYSTLAIKTFSEEENMINFICLIDWDIHAHMNQVLILMTYLKEKIKYTGLEHQKILRTSIGHWEFRKNWKFGERLEYFL